MKFIKQSKEVLLLYNNSYDKEATVLEHNLKQKQHHTQQIYYLLHLDPFSWTGFGLDGSLGIVYCKKCTEGK